MDYLTARELFFFFTFLLIFFFCEFHTVHVSPTCLPIPSDQSYTLATPTKENKTNKKKHRPTYIVYLHPQCPDLLSSAFAS